MPFDGLGTFTPKTPEYPAVTGTTIDAAERNALDLDLAQGLSNAMTRDGQGAATGHQNFGGKNLLNGGTLNGAALNITGAVVFSGGLDVTGVTNLHGGANIDGQLGVGNDITGYTSIKSVNDLYAGFGGAGEKRVYLHNAVRQTYFYLNDTATVGLYDISGAFSRWTTDTSGNFFANGNISAFSDERVKYSWKKLPSDFLVKLAKVRSGTYARKDVPLRQVGVGAQSLREVLPEAIVEGEDGMLSVAYGQAALVACVELAKEVVLLRRRISMLETAK